VNDSTGVVGQLHRCHHVVKVGVVILVIVVFYYCQIFWIKGREVFDVP
jgi:hypothetical protein